MKKKLLFSFLLIGTIASPFIVMQTINLRVRNLNQIRFCSEFSPGSNFSTKVQACINDIPSTGGVADARGMLGSQTSTATITISKHVTLLLPIATITCSAVPCFNVSAGGTSIIGPSQNSTKFIFNPGSDGNFITWSNGASVIAQGVIKGFTIDATGNTSKVKKGIVITDAEELELSDIQIANWHDTGNLSEGIEINGRQTILGSRLTVAADKPFRIGIDPNTSIVAADHFHFKDIYTIVGTGTVPTIQNNNWTIDDGVFLTNDTWDGYQAWVAGHNGFYWGDANSMSPSYNVSINNVRWEQDCFAISGCVANNGYALYISPSTNQFSWALNINNVVTDSFHNGIFIRNFHSGQLTGSFIDGLLTSLNVDSSVSMGILNNMFNLTAGATLTTTGFIPTQWCGNDDASAGQTTPKCGFGVPDPSDVLVIPNNQSLAGLNNIGTADIDMIKVDSAFNHVNIAQGGGATFTSGPLTVSADLPVGANTVLVLPNGTNHCLGGENAGGTDAYRLICLDSSNNVIVGPQDASNHAYTTSPSWCIGGDFGSGNCILRGSGNPNGSVTGYQGDLFINSNGGAGTTLYVKESGNNTNMGWVGK